MIDNIARAIECFDHGAFSDAERLCREMLSANPHNSQVRVLLGKTLQATGNAEAAQAEFQSVVKSAPTYVDAWLQWAKLLQSLGQTSKAEDCLRLGLTYAPDSIEVSDALALLLMAAGKTEEASALLERAVELSPHSHTSWFNLGAVRQRQGKRDDAIAAYRHVIKLNAHIPEAHNNLGDLLKPDDWDAAVQAFEAALTLRPHYPDALDNLGVLYFLRGRIPEALEKFEQALKHKPDFQRAMGHMTTALFIAGRLSEAWKLHRNRFVVAGLKNQPHGRFNIPVWNGESVQGKALLIWTELGLGEEILQAGMFPDALAVASKVTVECSPRLEKLFARSFPDILFVPRTNPTRASTVPISADYQIAGGDLGTIFRSDWEKFPNHAGYLVADAAKTQDFRKKYKGAGSKVVVGISWASSQSNLGKDKTLSLAEFGPILKQSGAVFVNLQYAASPKEVAAVEAALGLKIITDQAVDPSGDIDAVAAQVAAMDLVISVSNTTVHMAGALNVPVWNIVPAHTASGMWHWFSDSGKSAWYPAMKIFRRTEQTSADLMAKLAAELQAFIEAARE